MGKYRYISLPIALFLGVACAAMGQQESGPPKNSPTVQEKNRPLTNVDVLRMFKAGLGRNTILLLIQKSKTDFDTGPDALIEMKKQGVPEEILTAMLSSKSESNKQSTVATPIPSVPGSQLSSSDGSLSPGFRQSGIPAFDAIERVPTIKLEGESALAYEPRKLDAEKVLAEAKREIKSATDKDAYEVLRVWLFSKYQMLSREIDPAWTRYSKVVHQCSAEAHAYFASDEMNDYVRKMASQKTCREKEKELMSR